MKRSHNRLSPVSRTKRCRLPEHLEPRRCPATLTFQAEPVAEPIAGRDGTIANVGDIDADGDFDLIVISRSGVSWWENTATRNGGVVFGQHHSVWQHEEWSDWVDWRVEPGDLDGDADVDLLVSGEGLWWLENDARGEFRPHAVTVYTPYDIALTDVDMDGDLDVAAVSWHGRGGEAQLNWYENIDRIQPGTFGPGIRVPPTERKLWVYVSASLQAVDIDADGRDDLLLNGQGAFTSCAEFGWFRNRGEYLHPYAGDREIVPRLDGETLDCSMVEPAVVDLDSDGDLDIVGSHPWLKGLRWTEHTDGKGEFTAWQPIESSGRWAIDRVMAADLDGDGDSDLVLQGSPTFGNTHREHFELAWLENLDGQANFGPVQPIASDVRLSRIADIDLDGDLDILAETPGATPDAETQVIILRSQLNDDSQQPGDWDGDGVIDDVDFQLLRQHFGTSEPSPPAGDMNSDGRVDFADFLLFRELVRPPLAMDHESTESHE